MSSHHDHQPHDQDAGRGPSSNWVAVSATIHCLTGCAIGEVLGMVIGTALGWGNAATIVLSVILAFFFGYGLTMLPLLRSGLALGFASAASTQMCGGGNVGQAGATAQSGGMGGMCGGMMGQRTPTAEEMLEGKPAKPQQSGMMCPCCRNMAMMRGGQGMPDMDMPKQ
jgi:uncharacterized protein DUF4396